MADYFASGKYKSDLCVSSPMKGQLATGFADVLNAVYRGKPHSVVNPTVLKRLLGKWAPHLAGFSQQDSQEFMRFLVDGLAEDLNIGQGRKKPGDMKDEDLMKMTVEMQVGIYCLLFYSAKIQTHANTHKHTQSKH